MCDHVAAVAGMHNVMARAFYICDHMDVFLECATMDVPAQPATPVPDVCCEEFSADDADVCSSCGMERVAPPVSSGKRDTGSVNRRTKYNRTSHFGTTIDNFQGKAEHVPDHVIAYVRADLEGIAVTPSAVRRSLERNKTVSMRAYYNAYMHIWSVITESPPPDIGDIYDDIVRDFSLVEQAYVKLDNKMRKNMISSQYVLFQLLRRHNYMFPQEHFNMLAAERLASLDKIMEEIYASIGWTGFRPVVDKRAKK